MTRKEGSRLAQRVDSLTAPITSSSPAPRTSDRERSSNGASRRRTRRGTQKEKREHLDLAWTHPAPTSGVGYGEGSLLKTPRLSSSSLKGKKCGTTEWPREK